MLPTKTSLKLTEVFSAIYRRGRWIRGSDLSIGVLQRPQNENIRIGLRTKRGLKGGVARNRLRRKIRAIVYDDRPQLKKGSDLIIMIHPTRLDIKQDALRTELLRLCKQNHILL